MAERKEANGNKELNAHQTETRQPPPVGRGAANEVSQRAAFQSFMWIQSDSTSRFLYHHDHSFYSPATAAWRNGIASDYESGDCRFDPCGGHLHFCTWAMHRTNYNRLFSSVDQYNQQLDSFELPEDLPEFDGMPLSRTVTTQQVVNCQPRLGTRAAPKPEGSL